MADRLTVMRDGENVGVLEKEQIQPQLVTSMMIGHELEKSEKKDVYKRQVYKRPWSCGKGNTAHAVPQSWKIKVRRPKYGLQNGRNSDNECRGDRGRGGKIQAGRHKLQHIKMNDRRIKNGEKS